MRKVVVTTELRQRVEHDARYRAARAALPGDSWRDRGSCTTAADPDVFFPAPPDDLEPARRLCRACPVAGECLAEALDRSEIEGVWGGTTSAERRTMRAVWRLQRRLVSAGV